MTDNRNITEIMALIGCISYFIIVVFFDFSFTRNRILKRSTPVKRNHYTIFKPAR